MSAKATENVGAPLDVGELGEWDDVVSDGEPAAGDNREPVELLARVIAHVAHRTPGLRRVEKKLEGKDLKSGPLSDLFALLAQLWRRNRHVFLPAFESYVRNLKLGGGKPRKGGQSSSANGTGAPPDTGSGSGAAAPPAHADHVHWPGPYNDPAIRATTDPEGSS